MGNTLRASRFTSGYLLREAVLILLWAYVILAAGTVTGLINFRLQAASAVLATISGGGWLAVRVFQRREIPRAGIEWAWIAFLGAQFTAALLSEDVRRSLPVVAQYVTYALLFYCAFDLTRSGWPAELIEKTFLIVGVIVVGLALVEFLRLYLGWRALTAGMPFAPRFDFRLYAVFGEANLTAAFVNILMPIAIARALAPRRRLTRILLGLFVVGAVVVEYSASSRGGLLGAVTALIVFCAIWVGIVSPKARAGARRLWAAVRSRPILLLILLSAILLPLAWAARGALQFKGDATHNPLLRSRDGFWQAAWLAFRASPGWGTGPGTFPTDLMWNNSMPPSRPFLHAHSFPFTIAAESGLIGLAGLIAAVIVVARALWRARLAPTFESRARWAGVIAAFAGFAVHSLADDQTRYFSAAIPLAVLLALALAPDTSRTRYASSRSIPAGRSTLHVSSRTAFRPVPAGRTTHHSPRFRRRAVHASLLLPALASLLFTAHSLRAQAVAEQAIDSGIDGDWKTAAQKFDAAAARDPSFAWYWLEGGYAYGMLAAGGDQASLDAAIDRTERGLALEPDYALNHANLAALYWQAGRPAAALAEMRRAAELAPASAVFRLNAGVFEEATGDDEAALRDYYAALDDEPALAASAFWPTTPLRASAPDGWRAARAPDSPPRTSAQLIAGARRAIAAGDLPFAERDLAAAWKMDSQHNTLYLGFAELALARGQTARADRYLQAALWVQTQSNAEKVEPLLTWAELAVRQGDSDAAIVRYRQTFDAVTDYTIYGWGTWGWNPYAWFVFQRRSLPVDVLPQLTRADFTPDLGRRLLALGALYEARGDKENALLVYRRLLSNDPALTQARDKIARLSKP